MSRTLAVGLVAVACSTAAARDAAVAVIGGTPRLVVDGQPFSATAVMPSIRCRPGGDVGVLRQFADCGIRLSSDVWTVREREGGTNTWWIDEGVYDWAFFDALAHGLTDASATGLIIPRIKIDPPSRWLARHPEEMFSGLVDVRSRAWRRLYRRMLRDLVAHVEASDYSDRLIGYHLGALHCGEWIVYPLDKSALPPVVCASGDLYPPPSAIEARRERIRAIADGVADAVVDAASYLKELTQDRKLVGAFWGYFAASQEALLKGYASGKLDFCAAPPRYFKAREVGHGGCSQNYYLDTGRLHGCVFFEESDFRTYLSDPTSAPEGVTRRRPLDEAVGILRRTIGRRLAGGWENWWFMIGGSNTFGHPEMMETIRRGAEVARATLLTSRWRPAEVAVLTSAREYLTSAAAHDLRLCDTVKMDFHEEVLPVCGVPYDSYELGDVENPRLPDYRVYVFPNAFALTESQRAKVRELVGRPGRSAIWLGRPGYYRGMSASMANVSALTNGLCGTVFAQEPTEAEMRRALASAGVHLWIDTPDVMAAGCGFLMVHAATDGVKRISLPACADLVEIFGASRDRRDVRAFDETMKRGETRVWRMVEATRNRSTPTP